LVNICYLLVYIQQNPYHLTWPIILLRPHIRCTSNQLSSPFALVYTLKTVAPNAFITNQGWVRSISEPPSSQVRSTKRGTWAGTSQTYLQLSQTPVF
jgi:hypothetical protein